MADARADFNGDGKTDLAMRNTTNGTVELVQLDGVGATATHDYAFGSAWHLSV